MAEIVNGLINFWFDAASEWYLVLTGELSTYEAGNAMTLLALLLTLGVGWVIYRQIMGPAPVQEPNNGGVNVTVESNAAMGVLAVVLVMALILTLLAIVLYLAAYG